MEILASNHSPLKTKHKSFDKKFLELIRTAEKVDIAVGFISRDSVRNLLNIIHEQGKPYCNLIIGMHCFQGFNQGQIIALNDIHKYFKESGIGKVRLVDKFKFHGKVYLFCNDNDDLTSIVGSSNLHNTLTDNPIYEVDIAIDEENINKELNLLLEDLVVNSSEFSVSDIKKHTRKEKIIADSIHVSDTDDSLVDDFKGKVTTVTGKQLQGIKNNLDGTIAFQLPIKPFEKAPKSNINVCFGEGRKNQRGIIKKRPWDEVEILVPKKITRINNYPANIEIEVITDDGYKFHCKSSGDFNKNFRSTGSLSILGRWLKGKLIDKGVLNIGEPVMKSMLEKYGRDYISLTKIKNSNQWFLDFSSGEDAS